MVESPANSPDAELLERRRVGRPPFAALRGFSVVPRGGSGCDWLGRTGRRSGAAPEA
jgi:hypothetical protein